MSPVTTQQPERAPGEVGVEPMLSVAAVARRLGIAPATLRTWDRRYGLGPTDHTTGRHRRYGAQDIGRLEVMQRALLRGASPAEAARFALGSRGSAQRLTALSPLEATDDPVRITGGDFDVEDVRHADPSDLVNTGGKVLRLPGASRLARGLGRAVLAMDVTAVRQLLDRAIAEQGVVTTWDTMIRPVLVAIAQRWRQSGEGVEIEHLFSQCVTAALDTCVSGACVPANPRPVLLACVPDERHTLPLHALNAELALRGVGSLMFGAALPSAALSAAVRRIAPSAVFLWAQLRRHADCELLAALPRTRQRVRLFVGGPGWPLAALPSYAEPTESLAVAVDRICHVLLG
ncbi:MAG: MerR family transcriptional regulator [Kutzneria sp.]|nr:MerR family transcriptional regulator [Kutzneria sp.]MBV9843497.1 MerR family transcriptional regulator [Kutzneria sp.]